MMRCVLLAFVALTMQGQESLSQISAEAIHSRPPVGLSSSGRFVVLQDTDAAAAVWLWDTSLHRKKQLGKPGGGKAAFNWSPDEKYVYVTQPSGSGIYEVPSGRFHGFLTGSALIHSLIVSPDGRAAAFIRDHNLWTASAEGRKLRPLTDWGGANLLIGDADPLYGREFDARQHYWWSPDSASIAFIETEFKDADHYAVTGGALPVFRLKVLDLATGQVRKVSESTESWPYLMRVAWHPDSKRIVFYRMNRLQTTAELCLFAAGEIQTVLTEKDAYWVNAPETPIFLPDGNRLVVSSERTGARHVYLYQLTGQLVHDITPVELEVYRLHNAVDPKGGIFVSGSKGNKQEQQLFRLETENVGFKQMTSKAGWHDVNLTPAGNAFLDRYSSAMEPASVWWHREGDAAQEVLAASVTQKPISNEFLNIKTHDNMALPARLFKPKDFDSQKKYPVILYTFSGPRGRVVENAWDGWQMAWNRYIAEKGFLVLAVDVRGSGGYGHLFEEYVHYRFGAQEVADLREVVTYLRGLNYVDGTRLGIWGCDYGAHIVVHAMLQFPGGFKAGVADSPIIKWTGYNAYFTERYLGMPARRITEYNDSTALEDAWKMSGTLLVIESDQNPLIRSSQVDALRKAFAEVRRNKDVIKRLHVVNIPEVDYREKPAELAAVMEQMAQFFSQTL